jgi:hypothetical protein
MMRTCYVLVVAAVLCSGSAAAAQVQFNRDGFLLIEGKTLYRLYCDDENVVKDGKFHDGIIANGVHVCVASRPIEAK